MPVVAHDSFQVVQLAQQRRPDAIVLDLLMPAGTGLGALEKLKASARTATIPVIILSGVRDSVVEQRTRDLGVIEFLRKPVDDDALLAALARARAP